MLILRTLFEPDTEPREAERYRRLSSQDLLNFIIGASLYDENGQVSYVPYFTGTTEGNRLLREVFIRPARLKHYALMPTLREWLRQYYSMIARRGATDATHLLDFYCAALLYQRLQEQHAVEYPRIALAFQQRLLQDSDEEASLEALRGFIREASAAVSLLDCCMLDQPLVNQESRYSLHYYAVSDAELLQLLIEGLGPLKVQGSPEMAHAWRTGLAAALERRKPHPGTTPSRWQLGQELEDELGQLDGEGDILDWSARVWREGKEQERIEAEERKRQGVPRPNPRNFLKIFNSKD
jgi:hypothetical protein